MGEDGSASAIWQASCCTFFKRRALSVGKLTRMHTITLKTLLMCVVHSVLPTYLKSLFEWGRFLYFPLFGEATILLWEITKGSITSWIEFTKAFLDSFFHPLRCFNFKTRSLTSTKSVLNLFVNHSFD